MDEILKELIEKEKDIVLYGTGTYAAGVCVELINAGWRPICFVETNKSRDWLFDIPVYTVPYVMRRYPDANIVMSLDEKYHEEVKHYLAACGVTSECIIDMTNSQLKQLADKASSLSTRLINLYSQYLPTKKRLPEKDGKIIVFRLDGIGDVVLNTPMLRELRRNHPFSLIVLVVSKHAFFLMKNCPYIDEIYSFDQGIFGTYPMAYKLQKAQQYMEGIVKGRNFDIAIVPRFDADYYGASLLALFSNAEFRIGYSESVRPNKKRINKNYDKLFSCTLKIGDVKHEVQRNLDVLRSIGDVVCNDLPELWVSDIEIKKAKELFHSWGISGNKLLVAVGIGASVQVKRWSSANFAELIQKLHIKNNKLVFLLIGGSDAREAAQEIKQSLVEYWCIDLVNKLSLPELTAVLRFAAVYVGNDTGPMHMAAACGCKCLEISRFPLDGDCACQASDKRFSPYKVSCKIVNTEHGDTSEQEEYTDTIERVSVASVLKEFDALYNGD